MRKRVVKKRVVKSGFICPTCESTHWSTIMWDNKNNCALSKSEWIGTCRGCSFKWSRKDDWKYFQFTICPTREEFRKFRALEQKQHDDEVWTKVVFFGGS